MQSQKTRQPLLQPPNEVYFSGHVGVSRLRLAAAQSSPGHLCPCHVEALATKPAFMETPAPPMTEPPVQESATPASPVERAICSDPVELTPVDEIISYKYVQFRLDDRLGFHFNVRECSGGTDEGGMGDGRYLAYADIYDSSKIFLSTPDGSQIVRVLPGDQTPVWALSALSCADSLFLLFHWMLDCALSPFRPHQTLIVRRFCIGTRPAIAMSYQIIFQS